MARIVPIQQPKLTRGDRLRDLLNVLERRIGQLKRGTAEEALEIPVLCEEAWSIFEALDAQGVSLEAEEVRFESVVGQLESHASGFLRQIGGITALQALREELAAPADHRWWHIDAYVQAQQQARWLKWARWAGIGAVVLFVLILLYNRFLAPDPALREALDRQDAAVALMMEGDYTEALEEIEQSLALLPDEAEFWLVKGLLQTYLEAPTEAETSFQQAEQYFGGREEMLGARAQYYLRLADFEAVRADAEAILALNPDSPLAYYYLGVIAEWSGDFFTARQHYEKASALAEETEALELLVIIRMQLANMLNQVPPNLGTPSVTATP